MPNSLQALDHVIEDLEEGKTLVIYSSFHGGCSKEHAQEVADYLLDGGNRFALSAAGILKEQLGLELNEGEVVDHYLGALAIGDAETVLPFLKLVKYEAENKKPSNRYLVERVINALESEEEMEGDVEHAVSHLAQFMSGDGKDKAAEAVVSLGVVRNPNEYIDMIRNGSGLAIPFLYALRDQIQE
ncbi:hypothetical protein KY343_01045 [Candidatus Woesearchaeota archaeon]|nr:hypothetical protein [Candidatus Woesearchaeota archaeon]